MPQVQDLLQDRRLFYVETGQTVAQVARRMAELRVGAILVLSFNKLRGIFSERDLMTRVVVEGRDPETTPVEAVMTTGLATIEAHASLEEALAQMETHNCRHLPVMRGDEVAGFLSMRDLMHHELTTKTEELHHMRAYISGSV
jgi:signal-transduction protein with cAMP-binding, CBS, and nucleotidyltransferase domain